jgi:uncharacterized protein (AIM24 family)
MKHRIVGDHHQVIAFDLGPGDELLVFGGKLIFAKGNAVLQEGGLHIPGSRLPIAATLRCSGGPALAGIIPVNGGHIKRYDIGPPTGLVTTPGSIFILSKGVVASQFKIPQGTDQLLNPLGLLTLTGAGSAFLRTDENFLEFTLGTEEELSADAGHIVAFSAGLKLHPAPGEAGKGMVLFGGPGNIILAGK